MKAGIQDKAGDMPVVPSISNRFYLTCMIVLMIITFACDMTGVIVLMFRVEVGMAICGSRLVMQLIAYIAAVRIWDAKWVMYIYIASVCIEICVMIAALIIYIINDDHVVIITFYIFQAVFDVIIYVGSIIIFRFTN